MTDRLANLPEPNSAICDEISGFFAELTRIATNWLLTVHNAGELERAHTTLTQFVPGMRLNVVEHGALYYGLLEHIGLAIGTKRVNLDEADDDVKEFVLNTTDADKEHLRRATTQIRNPTGNISRRVVYALRQVTVEERYPKHRIYDKLIQKLIPIWRSVD